MLWPRYDVFLSYSRADTERVQPLLNELRRLGYRVFFDVQSIDPGKHWKERLDRSIRASRALVLCWSENARGHEYITYEYSRAEALHKPVFPWLLDRAPLPAMLEIQGINEPDAAKVAASLRPHLGWTLTRRRTLQVLGAVVLAIALGYGIWRSVQPPPPWEFQGEVYDRETRMPLAGVEVVVDTGQGEKHTQTDAQGKYVLLLPQPQPKSIPILFRKDGYEAEHPINVLTGQPFNTDMVKARLP
jgi:hypothetical protein